MTGEDEGEYAPLRLIVSCLLEGGPRHGLRVTNADPVPDRLVFIERGPRSNHPDQFYDALLEKVVEEMNRNKPWMVLSSFVTHHVYFRRGAFYDYVGWC